ncbi:hypothetical protein Dda_8075 [Drechslerella dactyloides]|uniref:Uncharacterized protein n=1 Tax=Drechslerella dactyloides TaxID=74499 RepID=A0AAD6IRH0_DREDA|nr:hypothetical protein Dda_8075 [Drechslerella dactyloides]
MDNHILRLRDILTVQIVAGRFRPQGCRCSLLLLLLWGDGSGEERVSKKVLGWSQNNQPVFGLSQNGALNANVTLLAMSKSAWSTLAGPIGQGGYNEQDDA